MDALKRNVIITVADSHVGDFVAEHWLASLKANMDLTDTDVVVLDYGLTDEQRARLSRAGAEVMPCTRDGSIVVIRFRDIANFLRRRNYQEVMMTDGGDIIFQTDLSSLFEKNTALRAVCEYYRQPISEMARFQKFMSADVATEVAAFLRDKKMVNAGVLIGSREKFIELCDFCFQNITDKTAFGPDQPLVAYFLYTQRFKELPNRYNFILYTAKDSFTIRAGKFFDEKGALIPIVHNAGRFSFIRAVRNFGFGPERNSLKHIRFFLIRLLIRLTNAV